MTSSNNGQYYIEAPGSQFCESCHEKVCQVSQRRT